MENEESMNWDKLEDEKKDELDHERLMEEFAYEFENDPKDITLRLDNLGYDVDDLDL